MRTRIVICALLLSACGTAPVVVRTVPVEVVRQIFVPMPDSVLSVCDNHPPLLVNGISNSELRQVALQWQNVYGPCLESHLEAIRNLQPK
jgi:hypothetical protein